VVKLEGPSVHGQFAALARSTAPSSLCPVAVRLLRLGAVPRIRVVHIGAGAEDAALTSQDHDLDVVVIRQLIKVLSHLSSHRGVIRIATIRIVNGESGDPRVLVMIEQYSVVSQRRNSLLTSSRDSLYQIPFRCLMG
jgi:hypothetical protein